MNKIKKLSSTGAASAVPSGNAILTTDANGAITEVTQKAMQNATMNNIDPNCMLDGVFIMYHRQSDDYPMMVKPHIWSSVQNSGEIADGVVLVEGGKMLVVAPTEADGGSLLWSSAAVSGSATTPSDRIMAMNDWNGKANTAEIISKSTSAAVTNTAAYAPGFCNLYSRVNANGKGLTAGKWWLPSVGEMMMIFANLTKINYALSLIPGATELVETWYWTSTENNAETAWFLYLNCGCLGTWATKFSSKLRVRPVSAFIQ